LIPDQSMWDLWWTVSVVQLSAPSTLVFPCHYHATDAPHSAQCCGV
jgi:hypothetical protein